MRIVPSGSGQPVIDGRIAVQINTKELGPKRWPT